MATIAVGGTIYSSSINTGSLDGKSSKAYKLRCGMTLNSQSVANNTSNVTFFVQMCSHGSYGFNGFTSPKAYQSYSVNGGSYTSDSYTQVKKVSASETSWKTVHSMTKTITHNTAGKATVRTRCYFDPHIASSNTTYYYVPAKTGYVYTDTVTLPDLHTPPTISFVSATEQNGYLTPASIGFRDNDIVLNQSIKLFRYNIAENAITIGQWGKTGEAVYADIFYKVPGTYARAEVIQVAGDRSWTLVASNEVADTTSSDAKTSVECYKDIEDIIKLCSNNIGNKFLIPNKKVKILVKNKKIFFIVNQ